MQKFEFRFLRLYDAVYGPCVMTNVLKQRNTSGLSICLILCTGVSNLSTLRSTEHRPGASTSNDSLVIRAQDGGSETELSSAQFESAHYQPSQTPRESIVEPAVWREEARNDSNDSIRPRHIEVTRYAPSGSANGRVVPISQPQLMHSPATPPSNAMPRGDYRSMVNSPSPGFRPATMTTAPLPMDHRSSPVLNSPATSGHSFGQMPQPRA
jgi:hypothetical protein